MADWHRYCRHKDYEILGASIRVHFPNGRTQKVSVEQDPKGYRLSSTVMGGTAVQAYLRENGDDAEQNLCARLLRRNRSAPLVGFKWASDYRILAETHIPQAGLTQSEFRLHLLQVAREADSLEHALTGQDRN